jgi:dolichol-phosphate mannosyltransferase
MSRVLVVVPTYEERASLPRALDGLRREVPDADVLVVDDASPDGTGALAEEYAERDATTAGRRAVHVLHRTGKQGLGTAYVAGFRWALERGYDVVVEMDADGSHRAEDLPALLARTDDAALVIGSRWVRGQRVRVARDGAAGARRHRRLPRLPGLGAGGAAAGPGGLARVLLPDRHGLAGGPRRR